MLTTSSFPGANYACMLHFMRQYFTTLQPVGWWVGVVQVSNLTRKIEIWCQISKFNFIKGYLPVWVYRRSLPSSTSGWWLSSTVAYQTWSLLRIDLPKRQLPHSEHANKIYQRSDHSPNHRLWECSKLTRPYQRGRTLPLLSQSGLWWRFLPPPQPFCPGPARSPSPAIRL